MFNYVNAAGTDLRYGKIVAHVLLVIVAIIFLFGSFGVVDAGERGIKTRLGNVAGTVEPGLYMKVPFIEKVHKMSIRTQTVTYERENPLASASSDLQDVSIASVTNYHVDPTKVVDIYLQYQTLAAFEESVIRPAVRDTVKATASQYSASDLVIKRPEFASAVAAKLNERLADTFIVVEQSNITDLQFSESFSAAIEAKVTAVQNAEAAKNKLEQVKYESEQTIVAAQGVAEAQRIKAQSLQSAGGEALVRLTLAEKWDGVLPTTMVPGSSVPFINVK